MKRYLFLSTAVIFSMSLSAQSDKTKYPDPEFTNEVYWYKKDSSKLVRLEKGSSKMNTKTKLGGMGGAENSYTIDRDKSPVRLSSGKDLSFIFSTGAADRKSTPQADSAMRANGIDPAMMNGFSGMMDPASMITLYEVEVDKDTRKVLLMKSGGMMPFASKKMKSSDKYGFSVKKIREGYWELVVDKNLPKGEYAFSVMGMGMGNMDGSVNLFAFAVD